MIQARSASEWIGVRLMIHSLALRACIAIQAGSLSCEVRSIPMSPNTGNPVNSCATGVEYGPVKSWLAEHSPYFRSVER